ncbi:MAG TPA: HPr family phosphocarrier protein [Lachnospiraceae bacterium]|nr:HPr family phosphocarrier protein [Lachnospiraceae bacterium]
MIKKPITIKLNDGLDARPIAMLVQEASQYASQVYIEIDNKKINAKSIMGMMSLKLAGGENLMVVAEGVDEEQAARGIEEFFENR